MNNLVSRNPVQRFKEGRKISFFQSGKPIKRFVLASSDNKFTKEFNTEAEARAYRKAHNITGVIRDQKNASDGSVVKSTRVTGKDANTTAYDRQEAEKYNHLSYKDAYSTAQKSGNKYFAYKGKVYKTDLKNGKDNMTDMMKMYGNNLGWDKDPKLQTKQSRTAREKYRSQIDAKQGNRNPSYQGKTNSQANAEADKQVAQRWNEKQFMDLMLPTPANMVNYGIDIITGNHPSKPHVSGLNVPGIFTDLTEGNYKDAGFRTLDLGLSFAPGARVNMTPGGTNITGGSVLLPNGTRTFSKWQLNSLGKNAVSPMEGVLRSPRGTQYFIDNGQFMKDISLPLMISNIPVQRTYNLEK